MTLILNLNLNMSFENYIFEKEYEIATSETILSNPGGRWFSQVLKSMGDST